MESVYFSLKEYKRRKEINNYLAKKSIGHFFVGDGKIPKNLSV